MRVIELENIKIPSLNNKYGVNRRTGKLYLSKEYRHYKELIAENCVRASIKAPYYVYMEFTTYNDIDNAIKATLDAIQGIAIDDDKNILRLVVEKNACKKSDMNKVIVEVSEL